MITSEQVVEKLGEILVPGAKRSLNALNLVREIDIGDGKVQVTLASTALAAGAQEWLAGKIKEVIPQDGVTVEFTEAKAAELNNIKHIIAIMSGKGGVGKSLVASLVAVGLRRRGYEVGILDADITGPSIPRMFGVSDRPAGSDTGILPVLARSGIAMMSINLLLPGEEEAVIWRGPLIGKTITQFGEEVLWGNLDYLIIDLPPGTADAPLTVLQSFPISGIVVVFTPQDLVEMIVKKAVNMAQKMSKRVLGVVENMAYLYVPEIDKKIEVFGKSHGAELAASVGAPLLAQLPIDPELAKKCDEGDIESYASGEIEKLAGALLAALPPEVKG